MAACTTFLLIFVLDWALILADMTLPECGRCGVCGGWLSWWLVHVYEPWVEKMVKKLALLGKLCLMCDDVFALKGQEV